jgi:purine-binding chemotaxis protein CheW
VAELITRAEASADRRRGTRDFLVFLLAGDLYAVGLTRIREILSPPPITPVPRARPAVLGVCSVRGLLVTVMDLRRRLQVEEQPLTRRARILLVEAQSGEVIGLMVDEVRHVARLSDAEIEMASNLLGGDVSEHVVGIGRPAGEVVVLLNLSSIVSA